MHFIQTHKQEAMISGGVLTALGLVFSQAWLLVLASLVAGLPIAVNAWEALRYKQISIELLVTIALVGAVLIGEPVESAVVSFLFLFGDWLEQRSLAKTRSAIQGLAAAAPKTARRVDGSTVPVGQLAVGDQVRVLAGETVPADGKVIGGHANIVEAAITGEPDAKRKQAGATVYSGTQISDGTVDIEVEKTGYNTVYQQIIDLIEDAQDAQSPVATFIQKFARWYTPLVLVIALIVGLVSRDVRLAITILVLGCPGALVIGAPVSNVVGLGFGAKHGILIKGGDVATKLDQIDTVMFDKTGTLTQGKISVVTAQYWAADRANVAEMVAAVEAATAHPLGQALVAYLQPQTTKTVEDVRVTRGVGVQAQVAGHTVSVGNQKILKQPQTLEQQEAIQAIVSGGASLVLATIDDKLVAAYGLRDQLRSDTATMLADLTASGKKTIVLSGDSQAAVEHMMTDLPLSQTHGGLLPADKVSAIKAAQARGEKVMFVGDGINDGPALAQADVGVAMGSGMDVAIDTADVILTSSRLTNLGVLFNLAKRMNNNIKQNLVIAIGTVALLLSGLLVGLVDMASGMLFHEISILLVIANALRLRHTPRKWQNLTAIKAHQPQTVNNEGK
ncbi:heavy metal translocating P-type ATPase [Lacticaseibacillus casei]|jgi:Cd2+/Zn2+-exporting ATPase|uniref:Cd(2+)-exporting ATPase n=1 Tax=Lacticaseibacillus huelsenbergensis TaxID=3035291 RepID=A0ABY8DTP4_9LACO|nr:MULTISPECIES: heavy metal translocating P-type ATPase [Lacticaseibacillus]MDG3062407.1 heavy metal translocating P-type ATPase [Lacticaseibacillus sp. BCRC 81376]QVI36352.1 heavy metal translocating P-type ATPase [Lacticaseibacillus casei]QXG58151.1 heavy metal translocating P-type ATPase [Lacticaseibacillus casei]WFB40374.1 heavy metal translocating P-type ATPase [Lacticaseibacillus huelsenbergensis]WFB42127.1 heavy metal translocating P-type ATPase [Lacticaseibacillus huelsenbergensis]